MFLLAPAKINLILRVIGKRSDGYHELATWMQKIELYDELAVKIEDNPGILLECIDSDLPEDDSNLVWQAAELFFNKSLNARGKGATIKLSKKIPVSAGLGGGSSDAGTLLKGLNTHFDSEFSSQELIEMGKSLGADVPFFVTDMESVFATGIGEKMEPLPALRGYTIVLVNPGINVSTSAIFAKYALTIADKNSTLTGSRKLCTKNLSPADFENDLEAVTIDQFPVIADIKKELRNLGAENVLMSGSGPTVFGVFRSSTVQHKHDLIYVINKLRKEFGEKVYIA